MRGLRYLLVLLCALTLSTTATSAQDGLNVKRVEFGQGDSMDIRMPSGTIIRNVPRGTTQSELLRRYQEYLDLEQRPVPHTTFTEEKNSAFRDFLDVVAPAFECAALASHAELDVDERERLFVYGAANVQVPLADLEPKRKVNPEARRIMTSREYWIGYLDSAAQASVRKHLMENTPSVAARSGEAWHQWWRTHAQTAFNKKNCPLIGR